MIKVGVIGVGHLGQHHARVYKGLDGVELVGVLDADAARAAEIAQKNSARAFADMDELLAAGLDAVSVAVPTVAHHEIAVRCLNAGVNVLVEKPFTKTVEEAEELNSIAEEKNLVIQVGHIERFNPTVSFIKEQVARPRFIEIHRLAPFKHRSTDIGVVLDLAIHDLDILLHLVGDEIDSFDAVGVSVLSVSEDIANIRIKYKDGCIANITASRVSMEEMRKIRVFSDNAYLSLDYKLQEGYVIRKSGGQLVRKDVPLEKDEPLKLELSSFISAVSHAHAPLVSGRHGQQVLELALEITRQIHAAKSAGAA